MYFLVSISNYYENNEITCR